MIFFLNDTWQYTAVVFLIHFELVSEKGFFGVIITLKGEVSLQGLGI